LVDLRGLISSRELNQDNLEVLFSDAKSLKGKKTKKPLSQNLGSSELGTVALLFEEPSTRTKTSFNEAVYTLGGRTVYFDFKSSSLSKGETFEETIFNLNSLEINGIVMRTSQENLPSKLKKLNLNMWIINAGDGKGEHPTQALGDTFCLMNSIGLNKKRITIIGDVEHSRVAHSLINLWPRLGVELSLLPTSKFKTRLNIFNSLKEAQDGSDVLYVLRPQKERWDEEGGSVIDSYSRLTVKSLNENQYLMAPGPTMPDVDISLGLIHHERSLVFQQVNWGIYGRMAIMRHLSNGGKFE